jgi:hypothetical protein
MIGLSGTEPSAASPYEENNLKGSAGRKACGPHIIKKEIFHEDRF